MRKQQIAIYILALWLTMISVFMILAQWVELKMFFMLSFIGFLVIVELIAPKYAQPYYLRYTRYLIAAGILIFCVLVVQSVMEILAIKFR